MPDGHGPPPPADAMGRLRSLLDAVPVPAAAKRALCRRVGGADRVYHGVAHLALLWRRHRRFAPAAGLDDPDTTRAVAGAIAYHDAVYVSGRRDNEERSAQLWLRDSEGAAIADEERRWVADTIRATADHAGYRPDLATADASLPLPERARLWLLDLDLTPIGEKRAAFDGNTAKLRAESADMPATRFEAGRLAFLRRLDSAPRIYRSPVLAAAFEATARGNIRRQLGPAAERTASGRPARSAG